MPRLIDITPTKSYATKENVAKAVEKRFGGNKDFENLRYFIH